MRALLVSGLSTFLGLSAWVAPGLAVGQEPSREAEPPKVSPADQPVRARVVIVDEAQAEGADDPRELPPAFEVGGESRVLNARVRRMLTRTHEMIRQADEAAEGSEDGQALLNAAKQLYNAARREALAGRNRRAMELAQVATTVASAPRMLSDLGEGGEGGAASETGGLLFLEPRLEGEGGPRFRVQIREKGEGTGEAADLEQLRRELKEMDVEELVQSLKSLQIGPLHIEVEGLDKFIEGEGGEDGGAADLVLKLKDLVAARSAREAGDEAGPLVGVGLALAAQDGEVVVQGVLPGSPAGEDGSIHEGDRLVGIQTDGETQSFEGMELTEIVTQIRGEEGTEVKLVIRHEGDDEDTVVTLKRQPLKVPDEVMEDQGGENGDQR